MADKISSLDFIAYVLVVVGGLNWALVGIFNYDLVASLFGAGSNLSRLFYLLVGLATVYLVIVSARFFDNDHNAHPAI